MCLLEVRLWKYFVCCDKTGGNLGFDTLFHPRGTESNDVLLKNCLVVLAGNELGCTMETQYSRAAKACLTCLNNDLDNQYLDDSKTKTERVNNTLVAIPFIDSA